MNRNLTIELHPRASDILGVEEKALPGLVELILQGHAKIVSKRGKSILKDSPESAVSLVILAGIPRVCVKEFRNRGIAHSVKGLLRPTQALRSFRNGARLDELGVGTAVPLALIRKLKFGLPEVEWIIMEAPLDALELDRFILSKFASGWTYSDRKVAAASFGRFMGELHGRGIFHSDLKTCNILVSEGARDSTGQANPEDLVFRLLDYDDVEFGRSVTEKKKVKNLVQLFLSCPSMAGLKLRLRFIRDYASASALDKSTKRHIIQRAFESCRGKKILYVGFDGDITECWDS